MYMVHRENEPPGGGNTNRGFQHRARASALNRRQSRNARVQAFSARYGNGAAPAHNRPYAASVFTTDWMEPLS